MPLLVSAKITGLHEPFATTRHITWIWSLIIWNMPTFMLQQIATVVKALTTPRKLALKRLLTCMCTFVGPKIMLKPELLLANITH